MSNEIPNALLKLDRGPDVGTGSYPIVLQQALPPASGCSPAPAPYRVRWP